jgi:hypothetical protein
MKLTAHLIIRLPPETWKLYNEGAWGKEPSEEARSAYLTVKTAAEDMHCAGHFVGLMVGDAVQIQEETP